MIIESTKNDSVKRARSLVNRKDRLEIGLHFIEGDKLVREAVVSGITFADAFVEEGHTMMLNILEGAGANVHIVTRQVMRSLTNTTEPQWVCATVQTPMQILPRYYDNGLFVILDCVQDPGNMGTIIRTADAFGARGVLLGDGCADPYSPKAVRSSMGSMYHIPIFFCNVTTELAKLHEQNFTLICGHLNGSEVLPEVSKSTVLVIGNEGNGVSDNVAEMCKKYRLPMYGYAESLNASVAAGILMYELATAMQCI